MLQNFYTSKNSVVAPELKAHVAMYKNQIKNGNSVLLIPHSQGNFYANASFDLIKDESTTADSRIGVVAIATPSSQLPEGGHYSTLIGDGVISLVRVLHGALPANVTNSQNGIFDHELIRHYINGDRSGPRILAQIESAADKINPPERADDPPASFTDPIKTGSGYFDKSLLPMEIWVLKNQKNPKPLSDVQCLAISALAMQHDNWGKHCAERNLKDTEEWMDFCIKSEWASETQRRYDSCFVYDVPSMFGFRAGSYLMEVLAKNPECKWNGKKLRATITPALVSQAKAFLRNPK